MRENLLDKKDKNTKTVEKYLAKYLQDLQTHFGLSDTQLVKLLQSTTCIIKKRNKPKRWWQFF